MIAVLAAALAAPLPCGPLDLATALSLAVVRSDEVAIKQAEVVGAEADRAIARAAAFFPGSTATLIAGPAPGARGDLFNPRAGYTNRGLTEVGPFGRIDINLVQPLWTWGQLSSAKEAAAAGVRGRELARDETTHEVQLRVLQLYWGVVLARRLLNLAAEVENAVKDMEKRIADSLAAADGQATQEDKFRVAIFKTEIEQRKTDAQKGLQLARIALAATLALRESELQLRDEDLPARPEVPVPEREEAFREAQRARPDLLALDQATQALDAQERASHGAQLPQLFAAGTFAYSRAPNRDIITNPWIRDDFNLLAFGVVIGLRQNLSFPLLHAQAEKASAELAKVRRERDGLARLVGLQTEQAVAELSAASNRQRATQAALSAGRSWFRSAGLNFGLGVSEARAVIEAYSGYIKSQIDNAQATFELLVARGHLDQVTGKALAQGESKCVLP
jgi:outer membrane protein TolC